MLGSDKSRGYCLEMICADFLAGANLQEGNPGRSPTRRDAASWTKRAGSSRRGRNTMNRALPKQGRKRLASEPYRSLRQEILRRDGWRCQSCGARSYLQIHHIEARSHLGDDSAYSGPCRSAFQSHDDSEQNLITLCARIYTDWYTENVETTIIEALKPIVNRTRLKLVRDSTRSKIILLYASVDSHEIGHRFINGLGDAKFRDSIHWGKNSACPNSEFGSRARMRRDCTSF